MGSNEQNKQKRNRLRYRDQRSAERRRTGRLSEKGKGIEKCKEVIINSHGVEKYSIGEIGNNTVIPMYGARWVLEISEETLVKYDCLTTMLHPQN